MLNLIALNRHWLNWLTAEKLGGSLKLCKNVKQAEKECSQKRKSEMAVLFLDLIFSSVPVFSFILAHFHSAGWWLLKLSAARRSVWDHGDIFSLLSLNHTTGVPGRFKPNWPLWTIRGEICVQMYKTVCVFRTQESGGTMPTQSFVWYIKTLLSIDLNHPEIVQTLLNKLNSKHPPYGRLHKKGQNVG